jgi:hypothetical protein
MGTSAIIHNLNNNQSRNRPEDIQQSVAIEFVTHHERLDSDNPYNPIIQNEALGNRLTYMN